MTDEEILTKYRDPSSRNYAFNLLVRKYQQKIYWHIRKMVIDHDDSDDLVQETFIKVWNSLEQFRGDSQLYTWIYRIATNECLNFPQQKTPTVFSAHRRCGRRIDGEVGNQFHLCYVRQ